MLRASAVATGTPVDLRGVVHRDVDPLIPAGAPLRALADAVTARDGAALGAARQGLVASVGTDGAVAAAGVAANFQMMNRILDATGVPVPRRRAELATELGIPHQRAGHG